MPATSLWRSYGLATLPLRWQWSAASVASHLLHCGSLVASLLWHFAFHATCRIFDGRSWGELRIEGAVCSDNAEGGWCRIDAI